MKQEQQEVVKDKVLPVARSVVVGFFRYGLLTLYPAYLILQKMPILFFGSQGAVKFDTEWDSLISLLIPKIQAIAIIFTDHGNNFFYIFVATIGAGLIGLVSYFAKLLWQLVLKLVETLGVKSAYLMAKIKLEAELAVEKQKLEEDSKKIKEENDSIRQENALLAKAKKEEIEEKKKLQEENEKARKKVEEQQKKEQNLIETFNERQIKQKELFDKFQAEKEKLEKEKERIELEKIKAEQLLRQTNEETQKQKSELEKISKELEKVSSDKDRFFNEKQTIMAERLEDQQKRKQNMESWYSKISRNKPKEELIKAIEVKLQEEKEKIDTFDDLKVSFLEDKLNSLRG